jgi:formylglycine-generating enzyme required for sulfatase activity/serine/threonine protein kinase
MAITVQEFIERLTQSGLMSAAEVSSFQDSLPPDKRPKDLQQFAQALVQQGKLTKYQAQAVYEGKTKGLVFGQYVVLDKLGEGGMGVVLRARHRRMKRTVAIKVLSSAAMKQAGAVDRFHREVEAVAKLSHPNIVTAYDADEHRGMHYLAMEYVEGHDLASVVKEHGPLPVQQAVECILQAARGLQYAHSKGIVHRDIKPGNLLLDKEGTVKILDMGLARIAGAEAALGGAEPLTTTGQVMGTCDYMAPEQSLDTHQADARADIYSLGCTFYRLLTGNPPYQAETFAKLFLMHLESPIPSLCDARPDVPKTLDAVCQRMLAKKPENRYQSMTEVIADLEAVLGVSFGRSTPVAPPALPESPSESVSGTWAFLQEVAPRGTLTEQKKPPPTERTQPCLNPEQDTGPKAKGKGSSSNFPAAPKGPSHPFDRPPSPPLRKARATVARVGRKTLVLAGLAGGLVLLLGIVLTFTLRQGTLVVEIDEQLGKDVQVAVYQGGEKVQLVDAKSGWRLSLSPGKYDLAVEGGNDQVQLDWRTITVTRGGQVKVKVTLTPAPLAVAPFDAQQARMYQDRWGQQLGVPVEITNSIGMKLVLIPPGEFMMGSPKELIEEELKAHASDTRYTEWLPREGPQHRVRITKPFYLGTYLVTQEEYQRVMGNNPSAFSAAGERKDAVAGQDTKRFPVENVSWDDAREFCRKLSEMPGEKAAGQRYRLPSEAQWQYACLAGSTGRYSFSSGRNGVPKESEEQELPDYGWFDGNSGGNTHAVGLKRASAWGLYDMQGNVWEWCQDWYDKDYYAKSPTDDPAGPLGGSARVLRGGSCLIPASICRSAFRFSNGPGWRYFDLGFRVSLVLAGKSGEQPVQQPVVAKEEQPTTPPAVKRVEPPPAPTQPLVHVIEPDKPPAGESPVRPPNEKVTTSPVPTSLSQQPPPPKSEASPTPTASRQKLPVPDDAAQAQARKAADALFKTETEKAKTAADKVTLAKRLLTQALDQTGDTAGQYVLMLRAKDLAATAGDAETAFQVIDQMAETFDVDRFAMKTDILTGWAKEARTPDGRKWVVEQLLALGDEAVDAGNLEAAKELGMLATSKSGGLRDKNLTLKLKAYRQRFIEAGKEIEELQEARAALARDSKDPKASLVLGQYLCFSKGDWEKGLPLLAQGSDETLKGLADRESTSPPMQPKEQVNLGDAWWEIASAHSRSQASAIKMHAARWYRQAEAAIPPSLRYNVEKRLAEARKLRSQLPPPAAAIAPFDEKHAKQHQQRWAEYLGVPVEITNSIGMKLVLIPPGKFLMGSPKELIEEELKRPDIDQWYKERLPSEGPQHPVRITRPFCLGTYLVTQEEYQRVMGTNPSEFSATGPHKDRVAGQDTKRFPVECANWGQAVEFCKKLSNMPEEKAAGRTYRLPSEAQWEYACRAGSTGRYSFSLGGNATARECDENRLSDYGWFNGNSAGMPHAVGLKRANAWGLYDMQGDLWEWCQDWYDSGYYAGSPTGDPTGLAGGGGRAALSPGACHPGSIPPQDRPRVPQLSQIPDKLAFAPMHPVNSPVGCFQAAWFRILRTGRSALGQ